MTLTVLRDGDVTDVVVNTEAIPLLGDATTRLVSWCGALVQEMYPGENPPPLQQPRSSFEPRHHLRCAHHGPHGPHLPYRMLAACMCVWRVQRWVSVAWCPSLAARHARWPRT